MINSGVSEEEVLNSFEDINLQDKEVTPDAPKNDEKVKDLLGQPSGKFDYKVFYSKPPSYDIPIELIVPFHVLFIRVIPDVDNSDCSVSFFIFLHLYHTCFFFI